MFWHEVGNFPIRETDSLDCKLRLGRWPNSWILQICLLQTEPDCAVLPECCMHSGLQISSSGQGFLMYFYIFLRAIVLAPSSQTENCFSITVREIHWPNRSPTAEQQYCVSLNPWQRALPDQGTMQGIAKNLMAAGISENEILVVSCTNYVQGNAIRLGHSWNNRRFVFPKCTVGFMCCNHPSNNTKNFFGGFYVFRKDLGIRFFNGFNSACRKDYEQ